MRAFVTGATGLIGDHVASKLRERGDEVVALVGSPERAGALRDAGCELVEGDLSSADAIRRGVEGCDSAFHVGADYRVGIPASERPAMFEANVRGTERVLDSAVEAGVRRIVYVSTVNRFGNTRGRVVDEGSGPTATTSPTTTRPRCSRTSSRRTASPGAPRSSSSCRAPCTGPATTPRWAT
jgi:nucleoside-diphosphate-sugar epimerase